MRERAALQHLHDAPVEVLDVSAGVLQPLDALLVFIASLVQSLLRLCLQLLRAAKRRLD